MSEPHTPPTAYHTATTFVAHAILLPAEEQVPWVNRAAALARDTAMEQGVDWHKLRAKMQSTVRKVTALVQELAEQFEEVQLQNPASLRQLDLFPPRTRAEARALAGSALADAMQRGDVRITTD